MNQISSHSCSPAGCLCFVTLHSSLLQQRRAFTTLWGNSAVGGHLSITQAAMKYVIGKRGGYTTTTRLQNVGAVTAKITKNSK